MPYTINYSDDSIDPITINDNTIDSTTSLNLPGKGYRNYGETIAENFLHLLENFSDHDVPRNPIVGQLWYDKDNQELKLCNDDTTAGSEVFKQIVISENLQKGKIEINAGSNSFPEFNMVNEETFSTPNKH